jgi:hypothetical protein
MRREGQAESLLILAFVALSFSGAYYYAMQYAAEVEFVCEQLTAHETTFMISAEFQNTGMSDAVISNIEIEIYLKPRNNDRILVGYRKLTEYLHVPSNQAQRSLIIANSTPYLHNHLTENNLEPYSQEYIEYLEESLIIIKITGTVRSGSVTTTDTFIDTV